MVDERIVTKTKEINQVMHDFNLTVKQRQDYIDTLTEDEMRGVFKYMMTAWVAKQD